MCRLDKVLRYWWIISIVLIICRIGDLFMLEIGIREGVDYCIAYQPFPRILALVSLSFLGLGAITFLLAAFRRKWRICLALLATFLVCFSLFFYELTHDPWGWW